MANGITYYMNLAGTQKTVMDRCVERCIALGSRQFSIPIREMEKELGKGHSSIYEAIARLIQHGLVNKVSRVSFGRSGGRVLYEIPEDVFVVASKGARLNSPASPSLQQTSVPVSTETFVYFLRNTETEAIKIGFGDNPHHRLKACQTGSDAPLELLGYFPASMNTERYLHKKFKKSRKHGEWFRPTKELLALISMLVDGESEESKVTDLNPSISQAA